MNLLWTLLLLVTGGVVGFWMRVVFVSREVARKETFRDGDLHAVAQIVHDHIAKRPVLRVEVFGPMSDLNDIGERFAVVLREFVKDAAFRSAMLNLGTECDKAAERADGFQSIEGCQHTKHIRTHSSNGAQTIEYCITCGKVLRWYDRERGE